MPVNVTVCPAPTPTSVKVQGQRQEMLLLIVFEFRTLCVFNCSVLMMPTIVWHGRLLYSAFQTSHKCFASDVPRLEAMPPRFMNHARLHFLSNLLLPHEVIGDSSNVWMEKFVVSPFFLCFVFSRSLFLSKRRRFYWFLVFIAVVPGCAWKLMLEHS